MNFDAKAEIHFHDQDRVSVIVESTGGPDEKLGLLNLFAGYACRHLVNLGRSQPSDSLANLLVQSGPVLPILAGHRNPDGPRLVTYAGSPGRRRFEARLHLSDTEYSFTASHKGFGFFGQGLGYYGPTSVTMLLQYLIEARSSDRGFLFELGLVTMACGSSHLDGRLTLTSQRQVAFSAAALAASGGNRPSSDDAKAEDAGGSKDDETMEELEDETEGGADDELEDGAADEAEEQPEPGNRARVDAPTLGRGLADLAVTMAGPDTLKMLVEDLPRKTTGDAFLAIAPLSVFAWIRASHNEPLRLGSPRSRQMILDNLSSFLVVQYVQSFRAHEDPDVILGAITRKVPALITVWNSSQAESPSPHWYVAKEVWFMLQEDRERADPVRISFLSSLLGRQTRTFLEFARQLEVTEG